MCGIVGFYPKKNKKANLHKILLLGIMNETRGEDSCGISIGRHRDVGIKDESVARNFISNNLEELAKTSLKNEPIIFHTRRSTVGAHTDENAHPFIYEKYNNNDLDDFFAIAHNGIIRNTIDLKTRFLKNLSNSVDLLKIDTHYIALSLAFSFAGYHKEADVLEFYEGNAALIYYNKNTFKVWKGGSNNTEERPMYYIETPEGWYFCSIDTSLKIVFNNTYEVTSLKNNELLTFHNHVFESSTIIDRKATTLSVVASGNKTYAEYEKNKWKAFGMTGYGEEDMYADCWEKPKKEKYYNTDIDFVLPKFSIVQNCYVDPTTLAKLKGIYHSYQDYRTSTYRLYSIQRSNIHAKFPVSFSDGILIRDYADWNILKTRFDKMHYATLDLYFLGELDRIKRVLVDFLPIYDAKQELIMVVYKDKDGDINYISKYDKDATEIPLMVGNSNIIVVSDGTAIDITTVDMFKTSKV